MPSQLRTFPLRNKDFGMGGLIRFTSRSQIWRRVSTFCRTVSSREDFETLDLPYGSKVIGPTALV